MTYARLISETRDAARACAGWLLFPVALALIVFQLVRPYKEPMGAKKPVGTSKKS